MSSLQTDNSYFYDKVKLRMNHLPNKKEINVLKAFAGNGKIWDYIKSHSNKTINILKIEQQKNKKGIYLQGNNIKYLKSIDLTSFDIIDLDSYGIPYGQMEIIFNNKTIKGTIVFITYINSIFGAINNKMLIKLGYTKTMIKKCPTLFNKNGLEKLKNYLVLKGIKNIIYRGYNRKHYICFVIKRG